MSASVTAVLTMNITTQETLSINIPGAAAPTIKHYLLDSVINLGSGTTPPISAICDFAFTLVAGALNIDLTNLPQTEGANLNATGLKVQAIMIVTPSGNAGHITITPGASNGYNLFGAASSVAVNPGSKKLCFDNATNPAVASGAKMITLTGTGTDVLNIIMLLG